MPWTKVSKPTGTGYTRINTSGKNIYDDPTVGFDDPAILFDSFDPVAWSDIAKPTGEGTGGEIIIKIGMATGLIMPLTYSTQHIIQTTQTQWTKIPKPTD